MALIIVNRAATIQLPDDTIHIVIFASRYDVYRDTLFGLRRNFEIKNIYTIRSKRCLDISFLVEINYYKHEHWQ